MNRILFLLLVSPLSLFAKIGIQTNLFGFTALPILVPSTYSIQIGTEHHLYKKFVIKPSIYYFNHNDLNNNKGSITYQDHLQKYGLRISMKFYINNQKVDQSMPLGFYVGTYSDHMIGMRKVVKNNTYLKSVEHRTGTYQAIGFNFGATFSNGKFTLEPNVGIGASYVTKHLLNQGEFLNFDPILQTYSTCHLQLNLGYRF